MWEFWSGQLAQIEWSMSLVQVIALALLVLWVYIIWPKEELQQVAKDKGLQRRLLLTLVVINALCF